MLANQCFVCGMERPDYDDLGIKKPSFDQHKDEDHEFWSYLFFINYLDKKDPTERTGVESFVSSKLEQEDLSWIPVGVGGCAPPPPIVHPPTAHRPPPTAHSHQVRTSFAVVCRDQRAHADGTDAGGDEGGDDNEGATEEPAAAKKKKRAPRKRRR